MFLRGAVSEVKVVEDFAAGEVSRGEARGVEGQRPSPPGLQDGDEEDHHDQDRHQGGHNLRFLAACLGGRRLFGRVQRIKFGERGGGGDSLFFLLRRLGGGSRGR